MARPGPEARLDEIEAVYRLRLTELRRVATAIVGNREAALDAVQDAFALAVLRRDQFRGDGSLEAWLWQIVVRRARDVVRVGATARTAGLDDDLAVDEPTDETGDAQAIHALVAELPERQRLALFLRYYADLDYATIAATLEISSGTVGATLNQARDNLRRLLTEVRS